MNGLILYEGPSEIDGAPIVTIVTGLTRASANRKTGAQLQTYILRSDMHPMSAIHGGADRSVCGDCPARGHVEVDLLGKRKSIGRSCYVTVMHGPHMVWRGYQKDGFYERVEPVLARRLLRGKSLRIGTYGDPGAVPIAIWEVALGRVASSTGFTHQWRQKPSLAAFCMASCDTEAERIEAKALGFRTFRVRRPGQSKLKGEGHCPASKEMGHATQCASCLLCGGHRTKAKADITIVAHGTGARHHRKEIA